MGLVVHVIAVGAGAEVAALEVAVGGAAVLAAVVRVEAAGVLARETQDSKVAVTALHCHSRLPGRAGIPPVAGIALDLCLFPCTGETVQAVA